jgi:hypothetical protein
VTRTDKAKTATKVHDLPHWGAPATLYRLSEPHGVFANVVVAHIGCRGGIYGRGRPKLRVFGCEPNGEINSICEIGAPTARYRGHRAALRTAGYRVAGR